jgi:uncharacterized protein YacL
MIIELILRLLGMIVLGMAGWRLGVYLADSAPQEVALPYLWVPILAGAVLGALTAPWITIRPIRYLRRRIRQLPAQELLAIIVGIIVGLIIAALLTPVLSSLPSPFGDVMPFIGALLFGYLGVAVMTLRRKDLLALLSRRFVSNDAASQEGRSVLLDTSVIIDGRIADISQTGFVQGTMVVPRFVLNELQHIADSADPLRRNRGRRGLEMLSRLKEDSLVPVHISDVDVPEARQVDDKLIMLAKRMACPIMTNDYNMNRVARLQGVMVMNINELANAVKSVWLPGETIEVRVIQEGKELGQGIAFLDDGTMIVVEEGRPYIGQSIPVLVKKVLQKVEGRLVFAQPDLKR